MVYKGKALTWFIVPSITSLALMYAALFYFNRILGIERTVFILLLMAIIEIVIHYTYRIKNERIDCRELAKILGVNYNGAFLKKLDAIEKLPYQFSDRKKMFFREEVIDFFYQNRGELKRLKKED